MLTGHRTTRQISNTTAEQTENIPQAVPHIQNKSRIVPPTSRMSMINAVSVAALPPPGPAPITVIPPAPPANQAAAGRRSYVVKEVERLKENREKRRARQAEIKEEKTALMNQDPGNPNWELSAMIR